MFEIKNLCVSIKEDNKEIIKGLNLKIKDGEVVALMGPNGSGKSTLANALMGHPKYKTSGQALIDDDNILLLSPDKRARKGLFLSFQYPHSIPGVTMSNFLRTAYNSTHEPPLTIAKFRRLLKDKMSVLGMDLSFTKRYVNKGWSGGEKKRGEILQLLILNPRIAVLDETDSGLDIDAIRIVSEGINKAKENNPSMSIILITHYKRILEYIKPDRVVVLVNGNIVESGNYELVEKLEQEGYDWIDSQ